MPRRSHPRATGRGLPRPGRPGGSRDGGTNEPAPNRPFPGTATQRSTPDGDFVVRTVPGAAATKPYLCPGCRHQIGAGTPHVVVWPVWTGQDDAGVARRRHWHTRCWERRAARGGPPLAGW